MYKALNSPIPPAGDNARALAEFVRIREGHRSAGRDHDVICTLEGRHFHVCDAFFVECLQHEGVLSVDAVPGAHRAIVRCGVKFIHTVPGDGGDAVGVALRDTAWHVDIVPTIPQTHHAIRRGGNHQGIVTSTDGNRRDGTRAALAVVTGAEAAFF